MASDPSSIENDLRQLSAAALDDELLARLEACADGTWTRLDALEMEFEQRLRGIAPARMPDSLMASLESVLNEVPFQSTAPRIVRFPAGELKTSRQPRAWWGAAAAVALLGGLAGWLVPSATPEKTAAAAPPAIRSAPAGPLIPAGFNRGLKEASDQGVIWQSNQQPHRVLKVVYQDRVTLKDASGHTYQVERPRVEYIIVPAKTD